MSKGNNHFKEILELTYKHKRKPKIWTFHINKFPALKHTLYYPYTLDAHEDP